MTRSHGDEAVSVPYGRIKAGTASPTGGIKSGDVVPASLDLTAPTGALQTLTFPVLIWEGTLADSDAVIVHPTLWEDDVNPVAHAIWTKAMIDAAATGYAATGYKSQDLTGHRIYRLQNSPSSCRVARSPAECSWDDPTVFIYDNTEGSSILECTTSTVDLVRRPCEAHGVDRPFGLHTYNLESLPAPAGVLLDRFVLLTRATVARAIQSSASKPEWRGTFVIPLNDGPYNEETVGNYELYLRVERVP
jgi:hypothetical protein